MILDTQWFRFQQTADSGDESFNVGAILFDQKTDDTKLFNNNDQFNKLAMNNDDNSESTFASRKYQNNQYDEIPTTNTHFGLDENSNQQRQQQRQQQQQQQQQQYGSQNQGTRGQFNGLTKKIADKIAAIQQIAVSHNIADNINYLNGALNVARDSVRLSANNFVSFYNSTMNNLDSGKLKYMYLNPENDTVFAQYHFNQIETVGSFKSDVRDARSGYYTIVMNNVYSNLTTGFYDDEHAVVRPAKFQNADANIKTQDGHATRAFDSAMQRFLGVLANVVSSEVKMSARNSAFVQIKNEILRPIVFQTTENNNKLFDLMWQEDDVAIEMPNIRLFQNAQLTSANEQLFKSMTFQRKSQDSYTMSYEFALYNLEWTSALTVMSAGKRTTTPPTKFNVEKIKFRVYISKSSFDHQQSCDNVSTAVSVRGLNYDLDENLRPEVVSAIDNNLQRYIKHYLESNIQTNLKQIVCNNNYNKY